MWRRVVRDAAAVGSLLVPLCAQAGQEPAPGQGVPGGNPPQWSDTGGDYPHTARIGETLELAVSAEDPDKQPLTFRVSSPLSCTTTAEVHGTTSTLRIRCKARNVDVGESEVVVEASDGTHTISKTFQVNVVEESEAYFLPGAAYSLLLPHDRDAWGTMQGFAVQIVIGSWIHRNDKYGPSHGRVYLDMGVLRSSRDDIGAALDLSFGFDLSVERNPQRRYLLPYFGLRGGALVNKTFGSVGHLTPLAGLHLYADRSVFLGAWVGYFLPLNGEKFDALQGVRVQAGANFTLW